MIRWLALLLAASTTLLALAEEEIAPLPEPDEGLEIEPPLLIQSRDKMGLPVVPTPTPRTDIARLEKKLKNAKSAAGSADRLYKMGAIAKVEAEDRVLRVVRLEADLAAARLDEAKGKAEAEEEEPARVAEAEEAAKRTREEKQRAEIEAAFRNLQRQQKLLALGSGSKSSVARAEKRLAELQGAAGVDGVAK